MLDRLNEFYENLSKGVFGALMVGVGSIIGYYLRALIDVWKRKKLWKTQYNLEELQKNQSALREFLGTPIVNFHTLHNVGQTFPMEDRRKLILTITDWTERNRKLFPDEIQKALNWFSNFAGTMLTDHGLELVRRGENYQKATEYHQILENYLKQVSEKLK